MVTRYSNIAQLVIGAHQLGPLKAISTAVLVNHPHNFIPPLFGNLWATQLPQESHSLCVTTGQIAASGMGQARQVTMLETLKYMN